MHILIEAIGTRGDVQPSIVLAKGLKAAGHQVSVLASADFHTWIVENGLNALTSRHNMQEFMQSDKGNDWVEQGAGNILHELQVMRRFVWEVGSEIFDEVGAFMEGVDVVISGLTSVFYTQQYIRKHNIPHILLALQPTIATRSPSATFEPFVKHRDHPLNLWAGRISYAAMWYTFGAHAAHLGTTRMGLPPETMRQAIHGFRNLPIIHAISPLVTPHATDFPPTLHTTGYLFMDVDANWQPSPTLSAFLEEGEPPVYLGFGSMGGRNVESITQKVLDALVKSGQRGIISSGWAGLYAENLPENIYLLTESVPHHWLFPRCRAVVHHGGAGTTAAALRAGVPQTIVPHIVDQPYWGRRVHELGVGMKPIPRRQLTADNLQHAIEGMVTTADLSRRAAELASAIRQEDGLGNAVRVIESLVR
jgi:UDP:flavonoid glycosyltransferase YjiC (YdhE family)